MFEKAASCCSRLDCRRFDTTLWTCGEFKLRTHPTFIPDALALPLAQHLKMLQSLQQLSSARDAIPELVMEDSEAMLGLCAWLTGPGRSIKEWLYWVPIVSEF